MRQENFNFELQSLICKFVKNSKITFGKKTFKEKRNTCG